MTRQKRPIIAAALIVTVAAALGGCGASVGQRIRADMSQQSEAYKEWWGQKMIYHVDAKVYFDPYSRQYFWFENDRWNDAATLPHYIVLRNDSPKVVRRARMLRQSKNAVEVQAFNPFYTPITQPGYQSTEVRGDTNPAVGFDFDDFADGWVSEDTEGWGGEDGQDN